MKIRDVGKLFQSLIWRLEDGTQLDRVSNEVATLLTDSPEMVSILRRIYRQMALIIVISA